MITIPSVTNREPMDSSLILLPTINFIASKDLVTLGFYRNAQPSPHDACVCLSVWGRRGCWIRLLLVSIALPVWPMSCALLIFLQACVS